MASHTSISPDSKSPRSSRVRIQRAFPFPKPGAAGCPTSSRDDSPAAKDACVKRIVYLGGLGKSEKLSPHLASRHEVGQILRDSGVETIEFRASIIIGSGSLSFEMIRALVDKLPVMIAPRWVREKAQPIAIDDVLSYLLEGCHVEIEGSQVFEIGPSGWRGGCPKR